MMDSIVQAFGAENAIYQGIVSAIISSPQHQRLFEDIAEYHLRTIRAQNQNGDEPASKKRKLANGSLPIHSGPATTVIELPELSFSMPQRKRLDLGIYHYSTSNTYTIAAKTADKSETVFEMPVSQIGQALKLPVPEKAQRQTNYVFLPPADNGMEPVLFTELVKDSDTRLDEALHAAGITPVAPSEQEFASAIPEAHRKNEKAFHVKAHRGSKDGFLFFLKTGIFFGFKKPLFFVELDRIESVSYTSILARTFNIVISCTEQGQEDGNVQEVEFSMIDTAEYVGINGYVSKHGLADASLAEGRRAKVAKHRGMSGQNGVSGEAAQNEEHDGRTELERAEAQLQDEEDELEEDFELDSDAEDSEGSGESDDEGYDGDLVKDELGSEAEDVSDDGEDRQEEEEEEVEEHADMEEVTHPPQPLHLTTMPPMIKNDPDPDDDDQL